MGGKNDGAALHIHEAVRTPAQTRALGRLLSRFFPEQVAILVNDGDAVLTRRDDIKKVEMVFGVEFRNGFS
jgi:hypothetical protein